MKIRYFRSTAARRQRREKEKAVAQQEYKERIAKWHKKFAWRPLEISTPDDDNEHSTVVVFETVMQKGRVTNNYGNNLPQFTETTWIRYPEKEYFRKKLDGTLEAEEQFSDLRHDGTDMSFQGANMGVSSRGSAKMSGRPAGPSSPSNTMSGPTTGPTK